MIRNYVRYRQLVDVTRKEDDPYDNWDKTPMDKFVEESWMKDIRGMPV